MRYAFEITHSDGELIQLVKAHSMEPEALAEEALELKNTIGEFFHVNILAIDEEPFYWLHRDYEVAENERTYNETISER